MSDGAKLARGDRVILCVSSASGIYAGAHSRTRAIIDSFGLVPLIYEGVRLSVRVGSLERELRDDFNSAHLIVILLDAKRGDLLADNWALAELNQRKTRPLLVYALDHASPREIEGLNLPVMVELVSGEAEFVTKLQNKLSQVMHAD